MYSNKFLTRLKNAYSVVVLTGNKIPEESDKLLFRQKEAVWKNHKVKDITTMATFNKDPKLFWEFYQSEIRLLKSIEPNLAHYALVDMERIIKDFLLITESINNLHRKAGSKKILEVFGNIYKFRCLNCNESIYLPEHPIDKLPPCKKCSGILRPDMILEDETVKPNLINKAQEISSGSDVFIAVGTSELIEPCVSLPSLAKANGSYLIEINAQETALTPHVDEYVYGNASKLLPQLIMLIEKIK